MIEVAEEVWISKAAASYLKTADIEDIMCGNCPAVESYPGSFDYVSGFGEPPTEECPCDFNLGCKECYMKQEYEDVIYTLVELDKMLGLKQPVKIVL